MLSPARAFALARFELKHLCQLVPKRMANYRDPQAVHLYPKAPRSPVASRAKGSKVRSTTALPKNVYAIHVQWAVAPWRPHRQFPSLRHQSNEFQLSSVPEGSHQRDVRGPPESKVRKLDSNPVGLRLPCVCLFGLHICTQAMRTLVVCKKEIQQPARTYSKPTVAATSRAIWPVTSMRGMGLVGVALTRPDCPETLCPQKVALSCLRKALPECASNPTSSYF